MKNTKFKIILLFSAVVFIGGFVLFYLNANNSRLPASFEDLKDLPQLSLTDDGEDISFDFPEDYNVCDEGESLMIVLEARNVAVLSETEPHIQIQITNSCETSFRSPVFSRYFCSEGLNYEEHEATVYKLINGLGFFPKEWSLKKIFVGEVEVSMENQPFIEDYVFSCDLE